MQIPSSNSILRQLTIFSVLVTLVASIYMLSYRARIESGDTLRAFDAMTSHARFGDWLLDESVWFKYFYDIFERTEYPLTEYDVDERFNLELAMPLLSVAQNVSQLGNIHTVWLFNIIVTSLTVGMLYLLARLLDYEDLTAVLFALSAGIATNLWAYSQTFFREPLVALFLLICVWLIQMARRRGYLSIAGIFLLLAAGLMFYCAYLTKFSAILILPAILAFAFPDISRMRQAKFYRWSIVLLVLQVVVLLLILLVSPFGQAFQSILESVFGGFVSTADNVIYAMRIYLLSIGGSIWGTSPVLLLSLAGAWILLRKREHRLVWTIWLALIGYALGHAILTGESWFGGQSWPPRFLVPIVPFVFLLALPVFDLISRKRNKIAIIAWLILLLYGVWIQFSSVSLMWYHYEDTLPLEANKLTEWEPGLNQIQYLRWVILPSRWNDLGIDFLWTRGNYPAWATLFGALLIACSGFLLWLLQYTENRVRWLVFLLPPLWIGLVFINLRAVYYLDVATQSQNEALHEVLDYLSINSREGDVIVLPNNTYERFILNHLDSNIVRPIILPPELAEPASEKQPAEVISNNPSDWLLMISSRAFHHVASHSDHFWLLANTSPFMTWSFRPLERYAALYYYPLQEVQLAHSDPTVRLLEYSTAHLAPNPFSTLGAETATDLKYGDAISLTGFTLASGKTYQAGQTVDLSLLWQSTEKLDFDYTLAWFLSDVNTNSVIAQGQDSMPQAGFAPTTSWLPNQSIWDNRALRLPAHIANGEYKLWVVLYRYNPDINDIERLAVSGSEVRDGTVGVLPVTLTVLS